MRQQYTCKEETCQREFTRTRSTQEFCCDHCRFMWHNRVKMQKLKYADEKGFDEQNLTTVSAEEDLF